jgi:lipopolysaccharide export system protein LptA
MILAARVSIRRLRAAVSAAGLAVLMCVAMDPLAAQQRGSGQVRSNPLGNFGSSQGGPIRIDANKLEVFDRESRAVYTGDVVAVRGKTTLRGSQMQIFYNRNRNAAGNGPAGRTAGAPAAGDQGAIEKIIVKGPVSVVCETQTATAKEMIYDAAARKVFLNGDVVVADGPNILRGERIVYDTESGQATVTTTPGGRVQSVIEQGQAKPQQNAQAGQSKGC